jgi:hypothetical protein
LREADRWRKDQQEIEIARPEGKHIAARVLSFVTQSGILTSVVNEILETERIGGGGLHEGGGRMLDCCWMGERQARRG